MIFDCFCYNGEKDVLTLRLIELWPYVDYFVIVEANKTQTLQSKPFYLEQEWEWFRTWQTKIRYFKITECPTDAPGTWKMENFQRNTIAEAVKYLQPNDDDLIMVSDADEIPDFNRMPHPITSGPFGCKMTYHVFYANLITENKDWVGTVVCPYSIFKNTTPQQLRNNKDYMSTANYCGWHLGNMGGKDAVYKKFHTHIEPIDKNKIVPFEEFSAEFDRKIKDGGSFLFSDKQDDSIKLKEIPIDYPNLPREFYPPTYPDLFYKKHE